MTMRVRAFAWFAIFCAVMFVCLHWTKESDRHPLLVESALKDFPKDHMLFAPCPGGQFVPRPKRSLT